MDLLLKKNCLALFVAASFLGLTHVLIGMVRCSRTSSILCLLIPMYNVAAKSLFLFLDMQLLSFNANNP
jgi:hypothetical protein